MVKHSFHVKIIIRDILVETVHSETPDNVKTELNLSSVTHFSVFKSAEVLINHNSCMIRCINV